MSSNVTISVSAPCFFRTIMMNIDLLLTYDKCAAKQIHFRSLESPPPRNEFTMISVSLCSLCNISSHVYANHQAHRITIALVNICARYNNPLLPNFLLNAKCPNRSERQQERATFQERCLWGKHFCAEWMGGVEGYNGINMAAASVVNFQWFHSSWNLSVAAPLSECW